MTESQLYGPLSEERPPGWDVVCFGALISCCLLMTDTPLVVNGGTRVIESLDTYGDDAVIVAGMLEQWGLSARLITSTVGQDQRGRSLEKDLAATGAKAEIVLSPDVKTPLEISICDPSGARTYLQQYRDAALESLKDADLTSITNTRLLYVDAYDYPYVEDPMRRANGCGVPVFLNLEFRHLQFDLMKQLMPYASICQVSMDEPTATGDVHDAAARLLGWGARTALVTNGSEGCLAATVDQAVLVKSPGLEVAYGHGAGAAFSAAYIHASLQGKDLEWCARFATAEAHLKCKVPDYRAFPIEEVSTLAQSLDFQRC